MRHASRAHAETGLGYIDDAGKKSYSSVQRNWEKASTMTQREIMLAAKGVPSKPAGAEESDKAKKRRAMAGCHDEEYRGLALPGAKEAECNARVLSGDLAFMLEVMDQ